MPVINMEQTGKQIAELRKNANLTVNDIKEALALTTSASFLRHTHAPGGACARC